MNNQMLVHNKNEKLQSLNQRISFTRESLKTRKLQYLLTENSANREYLTGFTGSAGWVLVGAEEVTLFVDSRYSQLASQQSPHCHIVELDKPFPAFLGDFSPSLKGSRVGFESGHVTHQTLLKLRNHARHIRFIPTFDIVERVRAMKDSYELSFLKRAVASADNAFSALFPYIKVGMTERELEWILEKLLRDHGADKSAWDPLIVAFGANSSMPHYHPEDSKLKPHDMIQLDFGARVGGYHSDISRVIFLGTPSDKHAHVYQTVLASQQRAKEMIRSGVASAIVDQCARDVITDQQFPPYGHGLSHGIGLEVHELPYISARSKDILKAGQVISVEPGIYLPGWGGVRLEDLVLIQKDHCETLTKAPKKIQDITIT